MSSRACLLILALLLPLGIGTEPALAAGAPTAHCSPGPADCSGWYRSDVTVTWTWESGGLPQSCTFMTITTDTTGAPVACTVSFNGTPYTTSVSIKRDATPPQVTGSTPARAPDAQGWYNHALSVTFAGTDATSGIASCTSPSYGSGDGASVSVSGSCADVAGNTTGASFGFKYDATAPAVTPSVDRAPDKRGWYRKPLTVSFAGTDATSGVAACTSPTRYAGPDRARAALVGSCRDAAGNVAEAGHAFQYDATAPKLAGAKARIEKGVARIAWRRSADAVLVELERTPGVNGRRTTVVYQGKGVSFTDRTVRDGVRYRYEIRAADVAGNVTRRAVTAAFDRPALYKPEAGAAVRAPLVLAWVAVAGARYYNVQLVRDGVKVLSSWPRAAKLRVGRTWRYAGKAQRLEPGRYRWYVWGARGTPERPRYGRLLGSSSFVVR